MQTTAYFQGHDSTSKFIDSLACVVWQFKPLECKHKTVKPLKQIYLTAKAVKAQGTACPLWPIIFIATPYWIHVFWQPGDTTCTCTCRFSWIILDRDMKLPTWDRVDLTEQGKATVIEPMSLYFLMWCLLNGSEGRYAVEAWCKNTKIAQTLYLTVCTMSVHVQ